MTRNFEEVVWLPSVDRRQRPIFKAIVAAMQRDISKGILREGGKPPAQRDLASHLDLSVGTITKAYQDAVRLGLATSEVGRGTFISHAAHLITSEPSLSSEELDLSINVPPPGRHMAVLHDLWRSVEQSSGFDRLFDYLPHRGTLAHREVISSWLRDNGVPVSAADLFLTNGAQHGLSIAAKLLANEGDTVVTESLTYSGFKAVADYLGLKVRGVPMDDQGLLPGALDQALSNTQSKVVYAMPTMQSPTGSVMDLSRRREIAAIIQEHNAWLIEDNVYGFLHPTNVTTLFSLLPERTFYLSSLAKCTAPGLRVGAMVVPPSFADQVTLALRSTSWMAAPVLVEIAARAISERVLESLIKERREEGLRRRGILRRIFADEVTGGDSASYQTWLKLPDASTAARVSGMARSAGIILAPSDAIRADDSSEFGLRLCIGGPTLDLLEIGLSRLKSLLVGPHPTLYSFV